MMPGDPVVGSTVLRRPAIQSPNYATGTSGWTINSDGSAEFNNLTIRGVFNGTDFIINSSGQFFYSGTPAANNLIASVAPAAGTDAFGNQYLADITSYSNGGGIASQLGTGSISMYSGTLAAGWTAQGSITLAGGGSVVISPGAGGGVLTSNNTLDDGAGNMSVAGGLTVGGSNQTSTVGLPNGGITGTSGAASAGTAHTHGPGSFSVSNGQHHHTL